MGQNPTTLLYCVHKVFTPLAEMQLQSMTEPISCFTYGCRHANVPLSWSPLYMLTWFEAKISNLDLSLHKRRYHWWSAQFLGSLTYLSLSSLFPFIRNGFLTANHWDLTFVPLLTCIKNVCWHNFRLGFSEQWWISWKVRLISQILCHFLQGWLSDVVHEL